MARLAIDIIHRAPSNKHFRQAFPRLTWSNANDIRTLIHLGKVRQALRLFDAYTDGFAVEYRRHRDDTQYRQKGFEYVNHGDPYKNTLIFDHKTGTFILGCWGNIVEAARDGEYP